VRAQPVPTFPAINASRRRPYGSRTIDSADDCQGSGAGPAVVNRIRMTVRTEGNRGLVSMCGADLQ
jgi:hypothetical protein